MKDRPIVSVVMSVYNGELHLAAAIESILSQTYKDFEYIIINDGSTDNSLAIIREFEKKDRRIVVRDRANKGLIYSLNEGIQLAKGHYIARMDADDMSMPERLEKQLAYMEEHNLDICGSAVRVFNTQREIRTWSYPVDDAAIKFMLKFKTAFAHPSVLMRTSLFKTGLRYADCKHAEDYRLWVDMALQNYKMGNMDAVLLRYRCHSGQVSRIHQKIQRKNTQNVSWYYQKKAKGYWPIIAVFMKQVQINGKRRRLLQLCSLINKERRKEGLRDDLFGSVIVSVFRSSHPMRVFLLFVYLRALRNHKKTPEEIVTFAVQALCTIDKNSSLYHFLKRFV